MQKNLGRMMVGHIALAPQTLAVASTATNGNKIDRQGYDHATVELIIGAVSGGTPSVTVKVQESATAGGTYTDITSAAFGAKVVAPVSVADTAYPTFIGLIDLKGVKRFIRIVATTGAGTPSIAIAVIIHLGDATHSLVSSAIATDTWSPGILNNATAPGVNQPEFTV